MIETEHLRLIVCERPHLEALARGHFELGRLLGVTIPGGWPHFPEAYTPDRLQSLPPGQDSDARGPYFFINPAERALVGSGGFAGGPDARGEVEIGYEIAPAYQGRGLATEAAHAMIGHAFADQRVQAVIAHTLAEPNASTRVLRKAGMW